jgi:hypothetical protein
MLLEKDLPHHELCHSCKALHQMQQWEGPCHRWFYIPIAFKIRVCSERPASFGRYNYRLSFSDVRFAMNRYLYGPPHGIDLSALALSTDWIKIRSDWEEGFTSIRPEASYVFAPYFKRLEVTPKILQDKLLLHACQRYWFNQRDANALKQRGLLMSQFHVCKHLFGFKLSHNPLRLVLCCALSHLKTKPATCLSCANTHACASCPSEYRVRVHNHGQAGP